MKDDVNSMGTSPERGGTDDMDNNGMGPFSYDNFISRRILTKKPPGAKVPRETGMLNVTNL
jgi:hypothetical protein